MRLDCIALRVVAALVHVLLVQSTCEGEGGKSSRAGRESSPQRDGEPIRSSSSSSSMHALPVVSRVCLLVTHVDFASLLHAGVRHGGEREEEGEGR